MFSNKKDKQKNKNLNIIEEEFEPELIITNENKIIIVDDENIETDSF